MADEKNLITTMSSVEVKPQGATRLRVCHLDYHTFVIGLKDLLPEDVLWRKEHPRVPAVVCLHEDHVCTCPWNCIVKLSFRCWKLFDCFVPLQQILILYSMEEPSLKRRKFAKVDTFGNVVLDAATVPIVEVPRLWALHIERDFMDAKRVAPYRQFRVNYSGLQIVLSKMVEERLDVGFDFWNVG